MTTLDVQSYVRAILIFYALNISKGILLTVPYTFPLVLTRKICATINSFFCC